MTGPKALRGGCRVIGAEDAGSEVSNVEGAEGSSKVAGEGARRRCLGTIAVLRSILNLGQGVL